MELTIFAFFSFFTFISLILSINKENAAIAIFSAVLFVLMGSVLLVDGIDIVYYGVASVTSPTNSSIISQQVTSTVNYKESWFRYMGILFYIVAMYLLSIPALDFIDKRMKKVED